MSRLRDRRGLLPMHTKPPINKETLRRCKELRNNSTPQEIIVWSRLRAKRFHNLKFKRQYPLGRYIIDFICLDKKLIIEIDGSQHKEENQDIYDKERARYLESLGFRIIRFWNNEVNTNIDGVFLKIEEFI
jgi:very-short-patch-repair endonuclease